jgi:aryl-alcohol dehydrogenase-like predicted oxidoreductase
MPTRRDALALAAKSATVLSFAPRLLSAQLSGELNRRPIPASGEEIPVIGLGSSATFSELASADETAALGEVFQTMVESGGTVFDTAPSYGRGSSEEVAGQLVADLGIGNQIFWATKLNVIGFRAAPGTSADPAAARAQVETSFERLQADPIDLIQVHNVADMETQFPILEDYKAEGRVRYIGTTTTFPGQYDTLLNLMQNESLDFIGIDYAVDNWEACEERIFPLAQDRGIAVMVYMPFGRTRLWDRVSGHDVPAFAGDFGAESWAQFFLKFAASHPAVTVVTPATSKPHHMLDNMGAAYGRMPDASERRQMIDYIESLPAT